MRQELRALHYEGVANWLPQKEIPKRSVGVFKVGFIHHDLPSACLALEYFSGLFPLLEVGVKRLLTGGGAHAPHEEQKRDFVPNPDLLHMSCYREVDFRVAISMAKEIPGHFNRADYLVKVADSLAKSKRHRRNKERLFDELIKATRGIAAGRPRAMAGIGVALFRAGFEERSRQIIEAQWARARDTSSFTSHVRSLVDIICQLVRGRLLRWAVPVLDDFLIYIRRRGGCEGNTGEGFNRLTAAALDAGRSDEAKQFLHRLDTGMRNFEEFEMRRLKMAEKRGSISLVHARDCLRLVFRPLHLALGRALVSE
jgi:hypothetical protein